MSCWRRRGRNRSRRSGCFLGGDDRRRSGGRRADDDRAFLSAGEGGFRLLRRGWRRGWRRRRDNGASRRPGGDGGLDGLGRGNDVGSLARLRHDAARGRLLLGWRGGFGSDGSRRPGRRGSRGHGRGRRYVSRWRRRRARGSEGLLVLALLDGLEDVAGLGDAGPVDLGPGLFLFCGRRLRGSASAAPEESAYAVGFFRFNGTGVRFLFGHSAFFQRIQDFSALNFQFTRQIVDSNFAHPPLSLPTVCPRTQNVIENLSNVGSSLFIIPGITRNCALISETPKFRCSGEGRITHPCPRRYLYPPSRRKPVHQHPPARRLRHVAGAGRW